MADRPVVLVAGASRGLGLELVRQFAERDWEVIATVPARLTVISNGKLVSDRRVGHGLRTTHWSQQKPASTYLISLVAAPLVKVRDEWNGVPVDYYVYPEDSALARPLFVYVKQSSFDENEDVRDFVRYMFDSNEEIATAALFMPLSEEQVNEGIAAFEEATS